MSATFMDESTPPDSRTPKGTSETIRREIDCSSSRVRSATASVSLMSCSVSVSDRSGRQSQNCRTVARPVWSTVIVWPAGNLKIPRNIVSGAGATMNVR